MKIRTRLYVGRTSADGTEQYTHKQVREFTTAYLTGNNISEGATYHVADGMWQGEHELTTIVEVLDVDAERMRDLKAALEENFNQQSVMLVNDAVEVEF